MGLTKVFQSVAGHCASECHVDLALVVDCSGSIRDTNALNDDNVDNWDLIVDFMVDLVTSINVGYGETHVAAVSFGTPSKRRVPFSIVIILFSHCQCQ